MLVHVCMMSVYLFFVLLHMYVGTKLAMITILGIEYTWYESER